MEKMKSHEKRETFSHLVDAAQLVHSSLLHQQLLPLLDLHRACRARDFRTKFIVTAMLCNLKTAAFV